MVPCQVTTTGMPIPSVVTVESGYLYYFEIRIQSISRRTNHNFLSFRSILASFVARRCHCKSIACESWTASRNIQERRGQGIIQLPRKPRSTVHASTDTSDEAHKLISARRFLIIDDPPLLSSQATALCCVGSLLLPSHMLLPPFPRGGCSGHA